MPDIIHRVGIRAIPERIFGALSTIDGLAGWWTEEINGAAAPGETITFQFRNPNGELMGTFHMEVLKQSLNQVQWQCRKGPADWIDTTITFDMKQENDFTIVLFGHRNWKEATESMAHCSMKWGVFMLSLKELVESGKGKPGPRDIKIDNWN